GVIDVGEDFHATGLDCLFELNERGGEALRGRYSAQSAVLGLKRQGRQTEKCQSQQDFARHDETSEYKAIKIFARFSSYALLILPQLLGSCKAPGGAMPHHSGFLVAKMEWAGCPGQCPLWVKSGHWSLSAEISSDRGLHMVGPDKESCVPDPTDRPKCPGRTPGFARLRPETS